MARRSGLGRGLDAILAAEPGAAAGGDDGSDHTDSGPPSLVLVLPVGEIHPNPNQPRKQFDDEALDELAASIQSVGLLQPLLVRPLADGFQLVAGERRWRAAQRAGLTELPVLVRDTDDQATLAQAIVENVQRADLNPIEEASAYQQLMQEFELTQEEVGTRVGRSRPAVANMLRLLQLEPEVQRLVLDGAISAGAARALLGIDDPVARRALAERAAAEELSVRQVEALVKRHEPTPPEATPGTTKPAALLELEGLLADRLATRVRLELGRRKGKIEIEFADLEDLERIFRLIS